MRMRCKDFGTLLGTALALFLTVTVLTGGLANAATTIVSPDFRMPILTPQSQTNAWTSVVPNALASYFTYVPYRNADAVKLGFPATCGNPALAINPISPNDPDVKSTEDCYTITAKKFPQQLAIPGILGGGAGLLDPAGTPFGAITNVYGYGSGGTGWTPPGAPAGVTVTGNAPAQFADNTFGTTGIWHFPAPTIKATKGRPVRVQWLNELPNEKPTNFDPTLCGNMPPDCFPYNRIVLHAHGAHVGPESDGFANSWYTPLFADKGNAWESTAQHGPEGTYRYPMDQEAATLWYHDHATGLTHVNTNMGLAGFFPVTDDSEKTLQGLPPGNAATKVLPIGDYELGFALQDRVFYADGQLAMPDAPIIDARDIVDTDNLANPLNCTYTYRPDGTITPNDLAKCPNTPLFMKDLTDGLVDHHLIPYVAGPGVQPLLATSSTLEFFGNMPVVNGVVYGKYNVQSRVYRMRFIGGTDSRAWIMRLKVAGTGTDPATNPARYLPFWQIGTEQGFLNNPVKLESMLLMPGERLDVLVDFNGNEVLDDLGNTVVNAQGVPIPLNLFGKQVILENWAGDGPYGGEPIVSVNAAAAADAAAIAADLPPYRSADIPEIMVFDVSVAKTPDADVPAPSAAVVLRNAIQQLPLDPLVPVRKVSLWEITDQYGRVMPTIDGRGFSGEITELVRLNDTEQWDIINTTVDAHPMHLHLVAFQLINREDIQVLGTDPLTGDPILNVTNAGVPPEPLTPPDYVVAQPPGSTLVTPPPYEAGWKDTIMCPPGKVTRVKAKFDIPGVYVWHCHILSHEEHDMMRPIVVTTPAGQVNLTASSNSRLSGSAVTPVTFMASTTTTIPAYPDGSGFEYQFSVTPPLGVTVTQPMPNMTSMFTSSTPGYSLVREVVWAPPTVPGTYVVTVNVKALGLVSATNSLKTATLNYLVAGPAISGATSTTAAGLYKAGSTINVTVTFNQAINSTGLAIALNNDVTLNTGVLANVSSFSGSFTVATGQDTQDDDPLDITAITGAITDAAGNAVSNLTVPAGANISNNKEITIDTTLPTLAITAPTAAFVNVADLTVSGTATDPAGIQGITVNGTAVTPDAGGAFSATVTLVAGANTITVVATDNAGNQTTSTHGVTLSTTLPTLTLTSTIAAFVNVADLTVSGTATGPAGIQGITVNGTAVTPDAGGAFSATVTLVAGANTITVVATDNAGNQTTSTHGVTLSTTLPTLTLTSTIAAFVNVADLTVSGTATSPVGIQGITVNGTAVTPGAGGAFSATVTLVAGANTITVVATDNAGNQTTSTRGVTLSTTLPTLTLTSTIAAFVNVANLTVSGTATGPVGIQGITVNGTAVTPGAGGAFSATVKLVAGANTITVVATDVAGNQTTTTRSVTLDTAAPVTTAATPPGTYVGSVSVILTANEAATIYYTVDGSDPTTSATRVQYKGPIGISADTTIKYSAVDPANNVEAVKSATYVIHVADLTASVKINGGAPFTSDTVVNLTLNASDPLGVAKMQFSNDGINYTAEETYSASKTWTLTPDDGLKTVYVRFRDMALPSGYLYAPITATITYGAKDGLYPGTSSYLASALKALQIASGLATADALDMIHCDVAPYFNGKANADGKIDLLDVYAILLRQVGQISTFQ